MANSVTRIYTNNNILSGSVSKVIPSRDMTRNFGSPEDYVEMHILDPLGKVIYSVVPFNQYSIPGTFQPSTAYTVQELIFDPLQDIKNLGIKFGTYNVTYNILRPKIVKDSVKSFYIKEISDDRLELRLYTGNITNNALIDGTVNLINEIQSLAYFKENYLNFGDNKLIPFVNVALDNTTSTSTVLIKLLNPLPTTYVVNTFLSIVDEIANPQLFEVNLELESTPVVFPTLRGPNFDLDLDNLRVGPTPYYNFNQVTHFNGQFAPQLQQLLGQLSASNFAINVDYTEYKYENWIHYSSAARRLEGFQYKLNNIEYYTSASASSALSSNINAQSDALLYQNKINGYIQSFDGWEKYLYYESSSYSWPKSNSTKPYINFSTTSSNGTIWYNGNHDSASLYDDNNQNYLLYALPGYIAENNDNELAFEFVASIGQMFDDIWIHIKAITDLYQAKNSLTEGISKDLVYFALQSMGINVYNDQDGNNVFNYLYGIDPDGNYLPQTGSWETLVSASKYQIPGQDLQKGIYKRLYHNLPLLLKSKGTNRFIQYLNTIFGIPDTIMSYTEYGGVDKVTSSFEYEYDRFTYALQSSGSNCIIIPWNYTSQSKTRTGYNDIVPNGIEFRFKAYPTASNPVTQSLFYSGSDIQFNLLYKSTGSSNSIYSGSVGNFGYFQFKLGGLSVTSSTIPIYNTSSNSDSDNDTDWYSVLVQRTNPNLRIGDVSTSQTYTFYVKNNVWGEVGHVTSASLTTATAATNSLWYYQGAMTFLSGSYPFSGSIQEIRLWSNYVSESTFDSHVLNPESIEGNYTSSAYNDLTARFPLGNDLYTYNHNIVTNVASVAPDQTIQRFTASFSNFPNENNYISFTEWYYADVANSGYSNPVTDKIRIYSGSEYGTQLLPNQSIEIKPIVPLTKDIHLLDAGLSPQDEINRDIIAHFGSTYDLDNIIGNPDTGSYQQFQTLQREYFKKYINKYNYKDYIRLIEFFHSSLFRTLKDFTPARTNLSTGIIIKPHLLERPRILRPEPFVTDGNNILSTINTAFLSGSNGGNYSQSLYGITYTLPIGNTVTLQSDGRDFFVGEFPSASINYHSLFKEFNSNPYTKYNSDFYSTTTNYQYPYPNYYSASVWNYSYNALKNNIPINNYSKKLLRAIYINSGSKLIQYLEPVQFQDFTTRYVRHYRPRYAGSKTTSTEYTFYNSQANSIFYKSLDSTYGQTAAIDKNTFKFVYFNTAVASGSQILAARERTNLFCKYIIDENSSLTELVSRKYEDIKNTEFWNLYQMQNTFKQGETLNVALFDNQVPSKQKPLDGNKVIFNSGYKYYPYMWRLNNNERLVYYIPAGQSTNPFLRPGSYYTNAQSSNNYSYTDWSGWHHGYDFYCSMACNLTTQLLPFDIKITVKLEWYVQDWNIFGSSGLYRSAITDFYFSRNNSYNGIYTATNNPFHYNEQNGKYFNGFIGATVLRVGPSNGIDPGAIFEITDNAADLIVNPMDKRWISASATFNSSNDGNTFYSGSLTVDSGGPIDSIINSYQGDLIPEYPIQFNIMDLVRFDSGSAADTTRYFSPENEYTIVEISRGGAYTAFKLDRPVDSFLTGSNSNGLPIISRYVFSKRVTDETNIVINHRKNFGPTSGGIIKNSNLLVNIDNKVADIVSGLKSKIFSTVLVS
jgi:hypothetical protein